MVKARCKFCEFEEDGRCVKKGVSIKLNKRRLCKYYKVDATKFNAYIERKTNTSKPKVMLRPDDWWDKKERKLARQMVKEEDLSNYKTTVDESKIDMVKSQNNSKHPLTGDLSRFTNSMIGDSNE